MTELERKRATFDRLHGDNENPAFIKEEAIFSSDGDDFLDSFEDLISKAEIPLDITNIHPVSLDTPTSQNLDVIHQLHGDQQQDQKSSNVRYMQANNQIREDTDNGQYSRQTSNNGFQLTTQSDDYARIPHLFNGKCSQVIPIQEEQYSTNCLPESPPDSGSERYSPTRRIETSQQSNFLPRKEGFSQSSGQVQKQRFNSPLSYDKASNPHFGNKMSLDGRIYNSPLDYNSDASDLQFTTINGSQIGVYGDMDHYASDTSKSIGSLSPGSSTSDASLTSNSGLSLNGVPASKKRKHSEQPNGQQTTEHLSAVLLSQQYRQQIAQPPIKQEPGILTAQRTNETRGGYFNDAYENTEGKKTSTLRLPSHTTSGNSRTPGNTRQDSVLHRNRTPPISNSIPSSHFTENNNAYQVIKWAPFLKETWTPVCDAMGKELKTVSYRVDADKGFNFAVADDTFVCQKKNHFQVTVHIGVVGHPYYVKTEEGLQPLDAFYINLYGVKYESQNQTIAIEQSQSDRSKKAFHPVKVDLPGDQVTKVTIGRLHFSETTTNNMRKKGRPNPDQRYFMCIVALHAQAGRKSYTVAASGTEKIIVRASNPGQFDQDDIQWQRAQVPDAIYHNGRVGINADHPDEALVVNGNIKLTGHLMQPSDKRAKEAIEEVDTKAQLQNVSNIRICKYRYSPEYAMYAGIDTNREETGVIAQEFQTVLPEAVTETGDVELPSGEVIPNFLVVDKDRLYMENVGAVKELCKLTGNFESRIDELERWNKKLNKLKSQGSVRSNVSAISGFTQSTASTSCSSRQGSGRYGPSGTSSGNGNKRNQSGNKKSKRPDSIACMNNRRTQITILFLTGVLALGLILFAGLYIFRVETDRLPTLGVNGGANISSTPILYSTTSSTSGESPEKVPPPDVVYCSDHDRTARLCSDSSAFCCATEYKGKALATKVCSKTILQVTPTIFSPLDPTPPGTDNPLTTPLDHLSYTKMKKLLIKLRHRLAGLKQGHTDTAKKIKSHIDKLKEKMKQQGAKLHNSKHIGNPSHMIQNPLKEVIPKKKRDVSDQFFVVPPQHISLAEPNTTLYKETTKTKYLDCEHDSSNFTFGIPISPKTPANIPITLRFTFAQKANTILCKTHFESNCPESLPIGARVAAMDSQSGQVVDFPLYFSSFVMSEYKFRVTTSEDAPEDVCEYPDEDIGVKYLEYFFHFYRHCKEPYPKLPNSSTKSY